MHAETVSARYWPALAAHDRPYELQPIATLATSIVRTLKACSCTVWALAYLEVEPIDRTAEQ